MAELDVYPGIEDGDAIVQAVTPGLSFAGPIGDALTGWLGPVLDLDADIEGICRGLTDTSAAAGPVLDLAGSHVLEPRGGLPDHEYRGIIDARWRQSWCDGTPTAVYEVWQALVGDGATRVQIRRWGTSAYLSANLPTRPSDTWQRRAGAIVRDAVAAGIEVSAHITWGDGLYWSDPWGAPWGVSLPVS